MNELEQVIASNIKAGGPISFKDFMSEALYHPGLGYYASPDTEIGRAGDFYTSPHLSPIFGTLLGRQVDEMWHVMKKPSVFTVVEPGAGHGYLSLDMLRYLSGTALWQSLRYVIIEINPSLRARQRELLKEFEGKITWATSPRELHAFSGVVISNELLDALPVHLIEMTGEGLKEVFIELKDGHFAERLQDPDTNRLADYLDEFGIKLPNGYRTEINLDIKDWLRRYAERLIEGFIITIDYGYPAWDYYGEERSRGTLLCYHQHQTNEEPLKHAGKQDITAHVNFSSIKTWGEALDLLPLGFCRQGPFLVSLGLDEVVMEFMKRPPAGGFDPLNVKGLIMPGTMGETHKVLIQHKGTGMPQLKGFSMKNELFKLMD
jgi:SAM-dependent MidA family methyltransferase